jgi:hypothetical protein
VPEEYRLSYAVEMRARILSAVAIGFVAGSALWVTPGAMAAADASRRVGLLPPWWALAVSTLVLAGACGAVAAACLATGRRVHLSPLLAAGVLLVPWLPFRVPAAFLIWTGPTALLVWAGVLAALLAANWPALQARAAGLPAWFGARPAPLVAAALALVLYTVASRQLSAVLPNGDSPHYLVITQSLLQDGDLQIENNHRQRDYLAYAHQDIRPHYLRRGANGQIYSIHAPGLPVLMLPAFALGGYPAVVVFLSILAALGTAIAWGTAYRVTGRQGAAWFAWAAVALSAPFFFHAFAVFPDAPGAVAVMAGVAALVRFERWQDDQAPAIGGVGRWLGIGTILAALPWLHTRFVFAAAALGACLALRLVTHRAWSRLAAFLIMPAIGAAGWFAYFRVIYGSFNPSVAYGGNPSSLGSIPGALPALFLDQQFGVIPNAPVYAVAIVGFFWLFRTRPRLAVELSVVALAYLSVVAAFEMWWGGTSAPARFTVPVLLLFAVPAAMFWDRSGPAWRAAGGISLALSLMISTVLTLAEEGRLLFNGRDGFARWLDWIAPVVDLPRALPAFLRDPAPVALLQSAIWVATMLVGVGCLGYVYRRTRLASSDPAASRGATGLLATAIFFVAAGLAASLTWATSGAAPVTPTSSALYLLRRSDPVRLPVALQYRPVQVIPPEALVARLNIGTSSRGRALAEPPLLFLGDVPPGSYRLRSAGEGGLRGVIQAVVGRSSRPVASWRVDPQQPADAVLRLPVGVNGLTISGDREAVDAARALTLQPIEVVPASARPTRERARAAVRYGSVGVFVVGDGVFLESTGLWIEGEATVPLGLQVAPPADKVAMRVRNGALANTIDLAAGTWRETLRLQAGEERMVEVPADAGGRALVSIHAERGFRPAETNPGSQDRRLLGAWLEF